jgi:hypothetical protein
VPLAVNPGRIEDIAFPLGAVASTTLARGLR